MLWWYLAPTLYKHAVSSLPTVSPTTAIYAYARPTISYAAFGDSRSTLSYKVSNILLGGDP